MTESSTPDSNQKVKRKATRPTSGGTATPKPRASAAAAAPRPPEIDPHQRHRMISERAYQLYEERRHSGRGSAVEDWQRAEAEIERMIAAQPAGPRDEDAHKLPKAEAKPRQPRNAPSEASPSTPRRRSPKPL